MGGAAYALRGVGVCEVGGLVPAVHKCERDITHTSTQVRPPLVVLVVSSRPPRSPRSLVWRRTRQTRRTSCSLPLSVVSVPLSLCTPLLVYGCLWVSPSGRDARRGKEDCTPSNARFPHITNPASSLRPSPLFILRPLSPSSTSIFATPPAHFLLPSDTVLSVIDVVIVNEAAERTPFTHSPCLTCPAADVRTPVPFVPRCLQKVSLAKLLH